MAPEKRIFIYVQGLSGTGHFVRMFEIARGLQPGHRVLLLEGGRAVPRPPAGVERLVVPAVRRGADGAVCSVDGEPVAAVLERRRAVLEEAIHQLRPDVVLVEDFPFSKWEMAQEIFHVIDCARGSNERVKLVCCLRDIGTRNRRPTDAADHPGRVRQALRESFDLVLVHADPAIVRIDDHLPWAADLGVPIRYTGFVSEKVGKAQRTDLGSGRGRRSRRFRVVVSVGGAASTSLIPLATRAWVDILPELSRVCSPELIVFLPAYATAEELARARREVTEPTIELRPYSPQFLQWLDSADLSISHAGYNTCTNIMETSTPAILLPNRGLSDQPLRARLLARLGLAVVLDIDSTTPAELGAAIRRQMDAETPRHDIDLSGARSARVILEELGEVTR